MFQLVHQYAQYFPSYIEEACWRTKMKANNHGIDPSWLRSEFQNAVCFFSLLLEIMLWHSQSQNEVCKYRWKLEGFGFNLGKPKIKKLWPSKFDKYHKTKKSIFREKSILRNQLYSILLVELYIQSHLPLSV